MRSLKNPHADIRKDYRITLELALILALSLAILAVRAPMESGSGDVAFTLAEQQVVQMEEIAQTEQIERPPPPPRPPIPVEVPNDAILDEVELDLDVTLDLDAIVELPPPPAPVVEEEEEIEPEIFVVVEQMPEIIGGVAKIYERLVYPEIARQAGVEGLVVVQVVVEKDGTPSGTMVARSASAILDNAAIAAVEGLRFVPGKQRGQPVRVRMAIPIRFRLRDVTAQGT